MPYNAAQFSQSRRFVMPRVFSPDELDALQRLIEDAPGGLRLDEIAAAMPGLPRRNLQRRLAALLRAERVRREGRGPATRYRRLLRTFTETLVERVRVGDAVEAERRLAVSREAAEVRELVGFPLHARQPVGYHREFLDGYRPNVDAWLPAATREHLRRIGTLAEQEPAAGTYARHLLDRVLIDLSWNSSRLEGNTYSLLETQRLLAFGESAQGRSAFEAQMILNHKHAIEFLVESEAAPALDRHTILSLHALLSDNLLPDPAAGGRLRARPVSIGQSVYEPPALPQLIEECFSLLLDKAAAVQDPYEQAFFLMVQLPYLQAFEDVNKRVSRLAANIPLMRGRLCPLSFVDVPQADYVQGLLGVYELNRVELLRDVFVWACERSAARYAVVRQSLGEPDPFRLRYRAPIVELVAEIVRGRYTQAQAPAHIRERAQSLPAADRARFQEAVETELLSLHEGNIVRYRLRPSEYAAWRAVWTARSRGA